MSEPLPKTERSYRGGRKRITIDPIEVGEKIKHYRLQRGLSQAELAEGICTHSTISHLEMGRHGVRIQLLEKIADKLNIHLHELYRPNDDQDFPTSVKIELVDAFIKRGELDSAREIIESLKKRGDLLSVEKNLLVLHEAVYYLKSAQPQLAIELLQPTIDHLEVESSTDDTLLCNLYNTLGTAFYYTQNFMRAYSAYKRAYQISNRFLVYDQLSAKVGYNLGLVCNELEFREEATVYLDRASEFYESVKDLNKMAHSYFALAIATGDESYLKHSLALYESIESIMMVQVIRQHHAFYNESKKDFKKAVQELQEIAREFVKLNEIERCVFTLSRAIVLCVNHSDLSKAQEILHVATSYKQQIDDSGQYIPYYYLAKAMYHYKVQNFEICLQDAYKAAELYDSMGMKVDCAEALGYVIKSLREKGLYQEALEVSMRVNDIILENRRK